MFGSWLRFDFVGWHLQFTFIKALRVSPRNALVKTNRKYYNNEKKKLCIPRQGHGARR